MADEKEDSESRTSRIDGSVGDNATNTIMGNNSTIYQYNNCIFIYTTDGSLKMISKDELSLEKHELLKADDADALSGRPIEVSIEQQFLRFIQTEYRSSKDKTDFTEISDEFREAKAKQAIKDANDRRAIDSSWMAAKQFYESLHHEIENLLAELISEAWLVNKVIDISFESFYEIITGPSRKDYEVIYKLAFGKQGSKQFYFQIFCRVHLPGVSIPEEPLPDTSNIFIFELSLHRMGLDFPNKSAWIIYQHTGELTLRGREIHGIENTDIPALGRMIRAWVSDREPWINIKVIARK